MKERIEEYFYNLAVTLGLTLDEFSVKVYNGPLIQNINGKYVLEKPSPYYFVQFCTDNIELETVLVNSLKEHLDITPTYNYRYKTMLDFDNTYVLKFKI